MLARLNHPNLVRVIDLAIDEATGLLYYVMDLVLYKDGYAHTLDDLEPDATRATTGVTNAVSQTKTRVERMVAEHEALLGE